MTTQTDQKPAEKTANIQVELAPDGIHVRVEWTGGLSSIPTVVERLKALGVVEIASTPAPAPRQQAKTAKVMPEYNADGIPCCPKHHKVLKEGNYGLYCSAKDDSTERGYCALKFDA